MSEKVIYLEGIDPLDFLGSNNNKFKIIKNYFPELKLVARGHEIKAIGEKSKIRDFEDKINILIDFLIVAFAMFLVIQAMNRLIKKPEVVPAAPTTKDCPECLMTIPLHAKRCGHCTAELK